METFNSTVKKLRELLLLGSFDGSKIFRCALITDSEKSKRLISEIVCALGRVKREWTVLHSVINDLKPEEIVRVIPPEIRAAYEAEVVPAEYGLVKSNVIHRIEFTRSSALRLLNLHPWRSATGSDFPTDLGVGAEVAVLTEAIQSQLADLEALKSDYAEPAAEAFAYADSDRYVQDVLPAEVEAIYNALPADFLVDEFEDEDIEQPIETLHAINAARDANPPFTSYLYRDLLEDLFTPSPSRDAKDAAEFLSSLLQYWTDFAEDEDSGYPSSWVSKGRSAMPLLDQVADRPVILQMLGMTFFRPESWLINLSALKPITMQSNRINRAGRGLLQQIYASFVFGQWTAVFALCRAALEYTVMERAKAENIPLDTPYGKRKHLAALVDDLLSKRPDLEGIRADIGEIRDQGNRALHRAVHPNESGGPIDAEQEFRKTALDVIDRLRRILQAIYAPSAARPAPRS